MFNRSKKDKPIYGIVGLGRFGTALALELAESGAELLVRIFQRSAARSSGGHFGTTREKSSGKRACISLSAAGQ